MKQSRRMYERIMNLIEEEVERADEAYCNSLSKEDLIKACTLADLQLKLNSALI